VVLALAIVGVLALHECKPERLQEERTLTLPEGAELPKWEKQDGGAKDEEIIRHEGFVVSYNPELRLANWVAWALTAEEAQGGVAERTDDFRPDPNLKGASAQTGDYKNSGYDRGHLAPAGDMGWSEAAMRESFYLTNICPQSPNLNRGLWRVVEERCREWAREYGVVLIVSGPVAQAGGERIGGNGVAVPQFFYKVICRLSDNKYHGIAFLLENRAYGKTDWRELAIPIDSVEEVTGLDFFSLLPDREEEAMERTVEADKW
jgi:endonuclease G